MRASCPAFSMQVAGKPVVTKNTGTHHSDLYSARRRYGVIPLPSFPSLKRTLEPRVLRAISHQRNGHPRSRALRTDDRPANRLSASVCRWSRLPTLPHWNDWDSRSEYRSRETPQQESRTRFRGSYGTNVQRPKRLVSPKPLQNGTARRSLLRSCSSATVVSGG